METDSGGMTKNIAINSDPEKLDDAPVDLYDENTIFAKHNTRYLPAENDSDEGPPGNDLPQELM